MAMRQERIQLVLDVLDKQPRSPAQITALVREHPELDDEFCLYWDVTDILVDLAEAGKIGKCPVSRLSPIPGIKTGPGRTHDKYHSL